MGTSITLGVCIAPLLWSLMRPGEQQVLLFALRRLWPLVRPVLGILFLVLGVLGIVLPVLQGVLFLLIGAALLGPRHILIRWPRVQYRVFLRRLRRSPRGWIRWIGQRGYQALHALMTRLNAIRVHRFNRLYATRRFRIVLEPSAEVQAQLDVWRKRYDPAQRYGLPPHVVLVAASRSFYRQELEAAIRHLASEQTPFHVALGQPALAEADERLICPVTVGHARIHALREAIEALVGDQVRFSQRSPWPGLTIAKLCQPTSLHAALTTINLPGLEWEVHSLCVYEERFGHVWYCVHSLPFFGTNRLAVEEDSWKRSTLQPNNSSILPPKS